MNLIVSDLQVQKTLSISLIDGMVDFLVSYQMVVTVSCEKKVCPISSVYQINLVVGEPKTLTLSKFKGKLILLL